jgi:two-component system phosphate regulon sensor histidine kinase PhoR
MVADHGIGIPVQDHDRIFERFYRVDKGRSRETGGTGLGLAIVKHVLTRHHAALDVKSELGKGSDFRAVFPAQRVAPTDPARAAA